MRTEKWEKILGFQIGDKVRIKLLPNHFPLNGVWTVIAKKGQTYVVERKEDKMLLAVKEKEMRKVEEEKWE